MPSPSKNFLKLIHAPQQLHNLKICMSLRLLTICGLSCIYMDGLAIQVMSRAAKASQYALGCVKHSQTIILNMHTCTHYKIVFFDAPQVLHTVQMLCTVVELMVLAPNGEEGEGEGEGRRRYSVEGEGISVPYSAKFLCSKILVNM